MSNVPKTITIDGVEFIQKDAANVSMPTSGVSMIRTKDAGVFYGTIAKADKDVITLNNARRVWYWSGACSLSQLAVDGTSKPKECRFPTPVPIITLFNVLEIIPMSQKAVDSLNSVAIWKQ